MLAVGVVDTDQKVTDTLKSLLEREFNDYTTQDFIKNATIDQRKDGQYFYNITPSNGMAYCLDRAFYTFYELTNAVFNDVPTNMNVFFETTLGQKEKGRRPYGQSAIRSSCVVFAGHGEPAERSMMQFFRNQQIPYTWEVSITIKLRRSFSTVPRCPFVDDPPCELSYGKPPRYAFNGVPLSEYIAKHYQMFNIEGKFSLFGASLMMLLGAECGGNSSMLLIPSVTDILSSIRYAMIMKVHIETADFVQPVAVPAEHVIAAEANEGVNVVEAEEDEDMEEVE